jgi:hypothetical protein
MLTIFQCDFSIIQRIVAGSLDASVTFSCSFGWSMKPLVVRKLPVAFWNGSYECNGITDVPN